MDRNNLFFSVVIPLYNKQKEIQRAVDSVLCQTWENFELVIVDDGSTDNSAQVVSRYTDSRIRVVRQANAGVSAARNKGIECSSHAFVAFLDADDAWKKEYLRTIHRLIGLYPEAGAYATAYEVIDTRKKVRVPCFDAIPPSLWEGVLPSFFRAALEGEPICASAVVVPKSVLADEGAFPLSTSMGEDKDLWERIALKYPVAYSTQIGATYFLNSSNRISRQYFASIRHGAVDLHAAVENRRPFFGTALSAIERNEIPQELLPDLKEYVEKYKLISAEIYIKFALKSKIARNILNQTTPQTKKLKYRKFLLYAFSFAPKIIIRFVYNIKNN